MTTRRDVEGLKTVFTRLLPFILFTSLLLAFSAILFHLFPFSVAEGGKIEPRQTYTPISYDFWSVLCARSLLLPLGKSSKPNYNYNYNVKFLGTSTIHVSALLPRKSYDYQTNL